jgi:hypothetical protein
MNLLSSVNAGFAACPNGWVELYIRGSSTRSTWYSSFEGDGPDSTGANITLDAYGAAEIYVNQLVDVVVKQSDGTLYRQYTDGYSSPNVEVRSNSFVGVDYNTAVSAAGNPTTLQSVLDRWLTSANAPDFEVLFRGSTHSLQDLAGVLGGLIINVQSPAYGAVGDGTTDDTSAILNALAAAVLTLNGNVGITVFFPKGNYRTTAVITWDYRVNIVMVPGSTIAIDSATEKTLKFTAANSTNFKTTFYGVGFKALQSNTGDCLSLEASQKLVLRNCTFGVDSNTNGHSIDVSSAQASLEVFDSRLVVNSSAKSALATTAVVSVLRFERNVFVSPATYNTTMVNGTGGSPWEGWFVDNVFDGTTNATTTGGTNTWVRPGSSNETLFRGNRVTGAFTYGFFLEGESRVVENSFNGCTNAIDCGGARLIAEGNRFVSVTNRYGSSTPSTGSYLEMDPIEVQSGGGTAYTLGTYVELTDLTSSGTNPTITFPNGVYVGQPRAIQAKNTNGGAWAGAVFAGATVVANTGVSAAINPASTASQMARFYWNGSAWVWWFKV